MHEYSICEGLVNAVLLELDRLERPPSRLARVHVVAGRLHQIVPDYLVQAFEILTRDTPAAGARLDLELKPVRGRCADCGWEGEVDPPFFHCGACESFHINVVEGKELYLNRLEVEYDDG